MVRFTAGIFLATVAYAFIAYWQLHAMNGQLTEVQTEATANATVVNRELTKLNASVWEQRLQAKAEANAASATTRAAQIAAAALASQATESVIEKQHFSEQLARLDAGNDAQLKVAKAAAKSAKTAEDALTTNGIQFSIDERPYVSGEVIREDWDGSTLSVTVGIKNWGKTPAYKVRVHGMVKPYTFNAPPIALREADTFYTMNEPRFTIWASFPGIEPGDVKLYHGGPTFNTQPELDYAKSNTWTWVGAGFVTYYDALGQKYTSDFCMHRGAKGNPPEYCAGHNDPDVPTEQPPKRAIHGTPAKPH